MEIKRTVYVLARDPFRIDLLKRFGEEGFIPLLNPPAIITICSGKNAKAIAPQHRPGVILLFSFDSDGLDWDLLRQIINTDFLNIANENDMSDIIAQTSLAFEAMERELTEGRPWPPFRGPFFLEE
jgi:hypothetical protein